MATANVFWSTAIDFRAFDISVPAFSFQNNISRSIDIYGAGPIAFDDQITLTASPGSAQNNSFIGTGITRSGQTITSGTLDIYVDNRPGGFDGYILFGGNPGASELNSIIDSVSTADDRAFLLSMLAGDDTVELSGGAMGAATNDYVFTGAGSDTVFGNGGNDTLLGQAGGDGILGGAGNDSLFGGAGGDEAFGDTGRDTVDGGAAADAIGGGTGRDWLIGNRGNDLLFGGAGADQFVLRNNHGDDTIKDWQDGVDKIRIESNVNINVNVNYTGPNALVTIAALNITILVENVANNSLQLTQQGDVFFIA